MKRIVLFAFAFGIAPAHASFVGFDIPGGGTQDGKGTYVNGINLEGAVTGNVIGSSGATSGFVRQPNGDVVTFNAATGADTHAIDISFAGVQTGYYTGDDAHNHGFTRSLAGEIVSFDPNIPPARRQSRSTATARLAGNIRTNEDCSAASCASWTAASRPSTATRTRRLSELL